MSRFNVRSNLPNKPTTAVCITPDKEGTRFKDYNSIFSIFFSTAVQNSFFLLFYFTLKCLFHLSKQVLLFDLQTDIINQKNHSCRKYISF